MRTLGVLWLSGHVSFTALLPKFQGNFGSDVRFGSDGDLFNVVECEANHDVDDI